MTPCHHYTLNHLKIQIKWLSYIQVLIEYYLYIKIEWNCILTDLDKVWFCIKKGLILLNWYSSIKPIHSIWSKWRESNPHNQLGRLMFYHWTTLAWRSRRESNPRSSPWQGDMLNRYTTRPYILEWRSRRDSNSRTSCPAYILSRDTSSPTWVLLQRAFLW